MDTAEEKHQTRPSINQNSIDQFTCEILVEIEAVVAVNTSNGKHGRSTHGRPVCLCRAHGASIKAFFCSRWCGHPSLSFNQYVPKARRGKPDSTDERPTVSKSIFLAGICQSTRTDLGLSALTTYETSIEKSVVPGSKRVLKINPSRHSRGVTFKKKKAET